MLFIVFLSCDVQAEKAEKQRLKEKYGYAIVDGRKEAVANFTVEPPGLFLGRGNHPKAGKFKVRLACVSLVISNLHKINKMRIASMRFRCSDVFFSFTFSNIHLQYAHCSFV
jgi:DNA topoisomerase-1